MGTDSEEVLKRLAQVERELQQMRDGLALMAVKRCENCKRFYRSSDAAALFDDGTEVVCYVCIHEWWPRRGGELELKDRETIEHKLMRWLVAHHHAQLIPPSHKLSDEQSQEFRLAADCDQCAVVGQRELGPQATQDPVNQSRVLAQQLCGIRTRQKGRLQCCTAIPELPAPVRKRRLAGIL